MARSNFFVEFFGASNTVFSKPYRKVQHGTARFEDIVRSLNSVDRKEQLATELLDLLSDKTW